MTAKVFQKVLGINLLVALIIGAIVFPLLTSNIQWITFIIFSVILAVITVSKLLCWQPNQISTILQKLNSTQAKVLIVDDNDANRRILTEMMGQFSVPTCQVNNGAAAIKLQEKHVFELILMDIEMLGLSGIETVKRIRDQEIDLRVPIVAVSAHHDKNKKLEALTSGFDDYLTKPVDTDQLQQCVNRWLSLEYSVPKSDSGKFTNKEIAQDQSLKDIEPINFKQDPGNKGKNQEKLSMIVDIKQCLTYSHNNKELAKDMMILLIVMISKEKNRMLNFFENKDWESLGFLVHKLNGGCCYCGVPQLQARAELIDQAIQNKDFSLVEQTFSNLIKSMDELLAWHNEHDLNIIFDTD